MVASQRYDWADFMKGILMFLVILYHSEVYYGPGHTWSWVFEPFFLSGFFFISGYLFCKDIRNVSFISKLKQTFRAIVVPYFIFVLLLAIPKVIIGHAGLKQIVIDILLLRASWFVISIAVMQLLFATVLKIKATITNLLFATGIFFLIGYLFVLLFRDCPQWILNNPWLYSEELPNRLPACINLALVQSPFFALGILFRHYEKNIPERIFNGGGYLIISIFLYVVLYIWIDHNYIGSSICVAVDEYNNILMIFLIGIIGIWAMMCISHKIKYCKPINYVGKYSILFYFLNGGVLTIVSPIIKKISLLDPNLYLNQLIVAIISTAVMFPMVWFINKYLPVIIGNKDSFNKLSKTLGLKIQW